MGIRLPPSDLCLKNPLLQTLPFNFKSCTKPCLTAVCCVYHSSYLHLIVVSSLVSRSCNFIVYVFERVIACFDSLGVLYLSVEEWRSGGGIFKRRQGRGRVRRERERRQGRGRIRREREKAGCMRRKGKKWKGGGGGRRGRRNRRNRGKGSE